MAQGLGISGVLRRDTASRAAKTEEPLPSVEVELGVKYRELRKAWEASSHGSALRHVWPAPARTARLRRSLGLRRSCQCQAVWCPGSKVARVLQPAGKLLPKMGADLLQAAYQCHLPLTHCRAGFMMGGKHHLYIEEAL